MAVTEKRRDAAIWIATSGGVGYCPIAPGTAGSAVGLLLVAGLGYLPLDRLWHVTALGAMAVGAFALGVWAADRGEKFFGCVDPRQVVIDEVAGQIITFLAWPGASWRWLLVGFVLFRIFDVVKPYPARRIERVPGGWGIMLDDVAAGVYSAVALTVLEFVLK